MFGGNFPSLGTTGICLTETFETETPPESVWRKLAKLRPHRKLFSGTFPSVDTAGICLAETNENLDPDGICLVEMFQA